jgi:TadE-like protein
MVMPAFVLLVLAGIEFGWAQHAAGSMNYALERASRSLVITPSLSESAMETKVLALLDSDTASKVDVSLAVNADDAQLTGVYVHTIDLPFLNPMPINFSRTVITPIP